MDANICNGRRELAQKIFRGLQTFAEPGSRWISHVIPRISDEIARGMVQVIQSSRRTIRTPRFIALIYHPDSTGGHVHLYHVCAYRGSHCRCRWVELLRSFLQETQARGGSGGPSGLKRRGRRQRIVYCSSLREEDIRNWLQYFLTPPRKILYLEVFEENPGHLLYRLKSLQGRESIEEGRATEPVETSLIQSEDCRTESDELSTVQGDSSSIERTSKVSNQGSGNLPRSGKRMPGKMKVKSAEHLWLVDKIRKLLPVPFSAACDLHEWLNDNEVNFLDKADLDYKRAVNHLQRETSLWTYENILNESLKVQGHYYARHSEHYMNIEDSFRYVNVLLKYQYKTKEKVSEFLEALYSILEKQLPKKNTLYIKSPPSSGKTWFVDCITAFYLNVGQVNNFNRNSSFPLNDCVNRRVLVWNEPNIEPAAFDTVKMLFAGDPLPANVKYQSGHVITRTPVIVTSNTYVVTPDDPIWSSRCYFTEWDVAPFLQEIERYPHPMCYPKLLQHYDIV